VPGPDALLPYQQRAARRASAAGADREQVRLPG
jgi:hypothetical protein